MPSSFFSHLECSVPCGAGPYDARHLHQVCTCGAPLLARYDLTAAKRWPKTSLGAREYSMWRYREILPLLESADKGLDAPVTLGEGWTPLVRARRLGKALGLDRVYVKNEAGNPTGSAKARGVSAALTRALHGGARVVACGGAGRAATALSAYAAHANLEARAFLTADTPRGFVDECKLYGGHVEVTPGVAEAIGAAAAGVSAKSWLDVTSLREPYSLEGTKTIGLELAEQFGWQVPDWIVCPVGSGLSLVAIWKAFSEMASLGWIDPVRRPHLVCVQAAGCAPLVRAFLAGAEKAAPWASVRTVADGLRAPSSIGDFLVLRAVRESSGLAVTAGDAEAIAGMKDLGALEGISAGPEGGAALHALRVLVGEGRLKAHDTVVILNTGTAAPYLDLLDPTP